jgi:hypothetical protein
MGLHAPGVVTMRADWIRPDPIITALLTGFGRYGVPLAVVYGVGALADIALSLLLTRSAVMDAFRRTGSVRPQQAAEWVSTNTTYSRACCIWRCDRRRCCRSVGA